MRFHLVICLALIFGLAAPAFAGSTRNDDLARIASSTDIFQDIVDTPESSIPLDIIQSAACIAIIPGDKRFAFFFGGEYGKGLVTCRIGNHLQQHWSAPAFVMISGGSFGFQWGGSSTDLILVFRNRDGLTKLLNDKFKIGGDATAAAGPVGRHVAASTDLELHAEILTYSRSRGLFAGISLNGAVFEPDDDADVAMYGASANTHQILSGEVPVPQPAEKLLSEIKKYAVS
jgi:lipid-binding SYLF domain-containing protein